MSGNLVADDGRWAAVFLSNFHFEAVGTNYFTAKLPPSPLQNFWLLSVEEQFYVVYPTLFLVMFLPNTILTPGRADSSDSRIQMARHHEIACCRRAEGAIDPATWAPLPP